MRARLVWSLIAAVALAALGWGWLAGGEPVPGRPRDLTAPGDAAWYTSLPLEPQAATAAYLARIPADMRKRGEAYSDSRMLAFWLRVLTVLAATALICATGLVARMRDRAGRIVSKRPLVDAVVALQYFVAMFALSLPVEIYATFVRPRRFGFSDRSFAAWLGDHLINWGVITIFYLRSASQRRCGGGQRTPDCRRCDEQPADLRWKCALRDGLPVRWQGSAV